jgi:hypothetical protein
MYTRITSKILYKTDTFKNSDYVCMYVYMYCVYLCVCKGQAGIRPSLALRSQELLEFRSNSELENFKIIIT